MKVNRTDQYEFLEGDNYLFVYQDDIGDSVIVPSGCKDRKDMIESYDIQNDDWKPVGVWKIKKINK